jgi:hypothetical protein
MKGKIFKFRGDCHIYTKLKLEDLAEIISKKYPLICHLPLAKEVSGKRFLQCTQRTLYWGC